MIDHLIRRESETVAVACIYCNYKQQQKQTVLQLIASVLRQLVIRRSAASDNVKKFYKEFHDNLQSSPTITEVVKVLQAEITIYSRVYIITDALDECLEGNQRELVKTLQRLTHANLMFTSRPLALIEEIFEGIARLDISANTNDVEKYVNGRISENSRLSRHVKKEPALRANIINRIVNNVRGMFVFLTTDTWICSGVYMADTLYRFLMAKLHMDSLANKRNSSTISAVRTALERLPTGVDETYDEAMERIRGQDDHDKEIAGQVLEWVSYARRQLTYQELQGALAVTRDEEMSDIDDEDLMDEKIFVDVCAGLVVIDENQGIVRLVRKYLPLEHDTTYRAHFW